MYRSRISWPIRLICKVVLLACLVTPLAPVTAQGSPGASDSDGPTLEEQIEELREQLDRLGNRISFSDRVDPYERLVLLQQLITLSTQVLELQLLVQQGGEEPGEAVTADEVDLEQVVAHLTPADQTVNVDMLYLDEDGVETIESLDFTLAGVASDSRFSRLIAEAREQTVEAVAVETALTNRSIGERTVVSAENPQMATWLAMDPDDPDRAELGEELFAQFGASSVIEQVLVFPGDENGRIIITSDQNEALEIKLVRTTHPRLDALYAFTYTYYVLEPGQLSALYPTTNPPTFQPAYIEVEEEIEPAFLPLTIDMTFGDIPFVEEIRGFEHRFITFMINNQTAIQAPSSQFGTVSPLYQPVQCLSQNDRVVMEGFINALIDELGFQNAYDLPVRFIAPVNFSVDRGTAHCGEVTRAF
ncbi:MAG: hypothetical protein ACOC4E_01605 [Patescibacteria group bacterium]